MKIRGFTLIELLAVIVILAIIALIATPIIVGIINDARESGYKRSIDNYGKAVEQAIAQKQIKEEVPTGNYTQSNDGKTLTKGTTEITVQYNGSKVECATSILYEDGKIYLSDCLVRGNLIDYTYGKAQYAYMWNTGSEKSGPSIGGDASNLATSVPSGTNCYLKYKLNDNNEVTNSYACAIFGGEEYCLEGGISNYYGWDEDPANYTGNVKKLYDIQQTVSGVSCNFDSVASVCYFFPITLFANQDSVDGAIYVTSGPNHCDVFIDGRSMCYRI